MTCIDTKWTGYQWLELSAGISKFKLHAYALEFFNKHGRLPKLHEIPGANSTEHVKKLLKVKTAPGQLLSLYTKAEDILAAVGVANLNDAIVELNNKYTDVRIDVSRDLVTGEALTFGPNNEVNIYIDSKPSKWGKSYEETLEDINTQDKASDRVMLNVLERLRPWGIKVHKGTSKELLELLQGKKAIREGTHTVAVALANGFIYDGEIYINTDKDKYNSATPIHELMHLLIGSMRFLNPVFYLLLLDKMSGLENWKTIAENYADVNEDGSFTRFINDINEEILVDQYAKYVTGQDSEISKLDQESLYELLSNVLLLIDRALFGIQSSETIPPSLLYTLSFDSLISTLGSKIATLSPIGSLSKLADGSFNSKEALRYRILLNKKNALLRNTDFSNGNYKLELHCI